MKIGTILAIIGICIFFIGCYKLHKYSMKTNKKYRRDVMESTAMLKEIKKNHYDNLISNIHSIGMIIWIGIIIFIMVLVRMDAITKINGMKYALFFTIGVVFFMVALLELLINKNARRRLKKKSKMS
jgi:hypothetical protein